jgi:hypothetical protein
VKLLAWALFTILFAIVSAVPARSGNATPEPVRVANPFIAPSTRVVQLKELWRVGGESEADEETFGLISDVVVDSHGNVYLLDRQANDIRVFSARGAFIRSFGREGEGPGEFRQPVGLVVTPANQIGVYQTNPIKLVLFTMDGNAAGELRFEMDPEHTIQYLTRVQCAGEFFLVSGVDFRNSQTGMEQVQVVMRFSGDGKFLCELARTSSHLDYSKPVVREDRPPRATIASSGVAYVSSNWNYEITASPACSVDRTITRDYDHRRRTKAEVDAIESRYRQSGGTAGTTIEISKVDPDIRWMTTDDRGRLWVLTSRGYVDLAPDSLGVFDVFDVSGTLVESVDLKGRGNFRHDGYFMIGNRFFVLRSGGSEDEETDEAMTVICYEIPGR